MFCLPSRAIRPGGILVVAIVASLGPPPAIAKAQVAGASQVTGRWDPRVRRPDGRVCPSAGKGSNEWQTFDIT